jgi:conjugal transfer/entry exclusion protein
MRRRELLLAVLLVLGYARLGHTQGAAIVYDPTNWATNMITMGESIITAANMITSVANQALELKALGDIVVAADIAEDMATIGAIIADLEGLQQDWRTLQALFDPRSVPTTMPAMLARVHAMNDAIYTSQRYAIKAQTLVTTLASTVKHITSLIDNVGALVGNKQANQTVIQVNTTMSKSLAILTTETTASHRMEALTAMRTEVIKAMDAEITRQYYAPWFKVQQ